MQKAWWSSLAISPMDCKEIQPVNPKGNQPWIFIGRTDAEAEAPVHWSSDAKSQLTGKDPDAGKDWGQKEKGVTEDETVGWHYQFSGHESGQTQGRKWNTVEPGMLQSMGSPRVRYDLATEQKQNRYIHTYACMYVWVCVYLYVYSHILHFTT